VTPADRAALSVSRLRAKRAFLEIVKLFQVVESDSDHLAAARRVMVYGIVTDI
jgi:hypothetical protein